MSRPEELAPPEVYYNEIEARKYTSNSRMMSIQNEMAERALELLNLPKKPHMLLDIGCGSGLSGEILSDAGHVWVGLDISKDMLDIARERAVEGDVLLHDMGQGLPFRAGVFEGAISISALQWLCNEDKTVNKPRKRLEKFFQTLFSVLARGSRAVFQFYPSDATQIEMITTAAMKCGFTGGLLVDYPNSSKAKKYFLVLFTGGSNAMPKALGTEEGPEPQAVTYANRETRKARKNARKPVKARDWVLDKKERQRKQGRKVRPDTRYTGRDRGPKF